MTFRKVSTIIPRLNKTKTHLILETTLINTLLPCKVLWTDDDIKNIEYPIKLDLTIPIILHDKHEFEQLLLYLRPILNSPKFSKGILLTTMRKNYADNKSPYFPSFSINIPNQIYKDFYIWNNFNSENFKQEIINYIQNNCSKPMLDKIKEYFNFEFDFHLIPVFMALKIWQQLISLPLDSDKKIIIIIGEKRLKIIKYNYLHPNPELLWDHLLNILSKAYTVDENFYSTQIQKTPFMSTERIFYYSIIFEEAYKYKNNFLDLKKIN